MDCNISSTHCHHVTKHKNDELSMVLSTSVQAHVIGMGLCEVTIHEISYLETLLFYSVADKFDSLTINPPVIWNCDQINGLIPFAWLRHLGATDKLVQQLFMAALSSWTVSVEKNIDVLATVLFAPMFHQVYALQRTIAASVPSGAAWRMEAFLAFLAFWWISVLFCNISCLISSWLEIRVIQE